MSAATGTESQLEGQWFAAVDLGSNSFHMVVARYDHGSIQIADRLKEMVRLGAGVHEDGSLDQSVARRAFESLARFGQRLRNIPAQNIVAVGTNAMRRIQGFDFLSEAETYLGHPIQVISGEEEARLIYHGVAHGISERGKQRLVIDIGGGSTEFVIGHSFKPQHLESLYFGCVSVTQRFFGDGTISESSWKKAKLAVAQELQRIAPTYREAGWEDTLGSSGTMRSVRNVCVASGFSERGITTDAIQQLRDRLLESGDSAQLQLPALSERRRPVFAGGAVIVDACLDELGIEQIIVAEYALREGLLYNLLGQILHQDPRDGTVAGLLDKYHVDRLHAERVRDLSFNLFDQAAAAWKLGAAERDWLGWGALLHEIGLTISHHGYHRHGAYLIGRSDLPGFTRLEQAIISALVGNHRRAVNQAVLNAILGRLREPTTQLLVLLRLAFALSRSRSLEPPPIPQLEVKDRNLTLRVEQAWASSHPLTIADLNDEVTALEPLGYKLQLT